VRYAPRSACLQPAVIVIRPPRRILSHVPDRHGRNRCYTAWLGHKMEL